MAAQAEQLDALRDELEQGRSIIWMIISAIGMLGLQTGFALLEVGMAKAKNVRAILVKNMLDYTLGLLVWFFVGWGIAYGHEKGASFIVTEPEDFARFVQQFGFAVTGSTILSGAVLGRMKLEPYLLVAFTFTAFTFPLAARWVWAEAGWLKDLGFLDYAGSGVVHLTGGWYSIIGAWFTGPRVGRFVGSGEDAEVRPMKGHSASLEGLGYMLLTIGWLFFNTGSSPTPDREGVLSASRAFINTLLGLASSTLAVTVYTRARRKVYLLDITGNGMLAGLVSVTGPCGYVEPWAACVIGVLGGMVFMGCSALVLRLRIDDALDAFAVHGACGLWGVVAIGLFHRADGAVISGGSGALLGTQLIGAAALSGLSIAVVTTAMILLRVTVGVALDEDDQLLGLDIKYHDGYAYPDFKSADVAEYNATRDAAARRMVASIIRPLETSSTRAHSVEPSAAPSSVNRVSRDDSEEVTEDDRGHEPSTGTPHYGPWRFGRWPGDSSSSDGNAADDLHDDDDDDDSQASSVASAPAPRMLANDTADGPSEDPIPEATSARGLEPHKADPSRDPEDTLGDMSNATGVRTASLDDNAPAADFEHREPAVADDAGQNERIAPPKHQGDGSPEENAPAQAPSTTMQAEEVDPCHSLVIRIESGEGQGQGQELKEPAPKHTSMNMANTNTPPPPLSPLSPPPPQSPPPLVPSSLVRAAVQRLEGDDGEQSKSN